MLDEERPRNLSDLILGNSPAITNASYGIAAASVLPTLVKAIREGARVAGEHSAGRRVLGTRITEKTPEPLIKAGNPTRETIGTPRMPKLVGGRLGARRVDQKLGTNQRVLGALQEGLGKSLIDVLTNEDYRSYINPYSDEQRAALKFPNGYDPSTKTGPSKKLIEAIPENIRRMYGDVSATSKGKPGAYETTANIGQIDRASAKLNSYIKQMDAAVEGEQYRRLAGIRQRMNADPDLRPLMTTAMRRGTRPRWGGLTTEPADWATHDTSLNPAPGPDGKPKTGLSRAGKLLRSGGWSALGAGASIGGNYLLDFLGRKFADQVAADNPPPPESSGTDVQTPDVVQIIKDYRESMDAHALPTAQDKSNWLRNVFAMYPNMNYQTRLEIRNRLGIPR